jgi:IMP dehydrogenase
MTLNFSWTDIKNRGRGLTFDDVLLTPQKSEVRSRRDPSLESHITKKYKFQTPILSANMDTVTETEMALAMARMGGLGVLHRFVSTETQVGFVEALKDSGVEIISASMGVNEEDRDRATKLVAAGVKIMTIDIAHGHSIAMLDTMKWLKDKFPDIEIIAGNVATPEATEELIAFGASAIKVGIGPGSMCTTRIITGCGVPQLTAIAQCSEIGRKYQVPIIADGGLRTSGDIVKAFAAGASAIMLGSMLAGTIETPGDIKMGKKQYRGMASKAAQVTWRGGVPEGMAPEGESHQVTIKGHVRDVILEITGGVRSGMSYLNATSIDEISKNARFMEMTANGIGESRAHGLSTST